MRVQDQNKLYVGRIRCIGEVTKLDVNNIREQPPTYEDCKEDTSLAIK